LTEIYCHIFIDDSLDWHYVIYQLLSRRRYVFITERSVGDKSNI